MGLTKSSTEKRLLASDIKYLKNTNGYTIALAGNPNVGKSTIFNSITGMHQHTGNWPGKTVANATGKTQYKDTEMLWVDIPGTYSIMSNSEEEEIARDYICFGNPDATVVVVDATCLERNLNLVFQIMEITDNIIVCVNLLDEAKKKKIKIDLDELSTQLGVPVVGTIARKKKTLNHLLETVYKVCRKNEIPKPNKIEYTAVIEKKITELEKVVKKEIEIKNYLYRWVSIKIIDGEKKILETIEKNCNQEIQNNFNIQNYNKKIKEDLKKEGITIHNFKEKIVSSIMEKAENICKKVCIFENEDYAKRDRKIDKIITSKKWGIPIMILFLGIIFWLTIIGANYPSQLLFEAFAKLQVILVDFLNYINCPTWICDVLISGVYQTLTWVISVMLPPMAIFFPLFTFLEDLGYLPRMAFNMDGFFKKACCSGKQMITMCMGFGCNACGVTGCRIIDSPRERLIAILTNNFVPCNRKISISNNNSECIYSRNNARNRSINNIYISSIRNSNTRNLFNYSDFKNIIKNYIKRNAIIICIRITTL